eukprot:m51a1_g6407 hypothetical protein (321) ;mRNA; f:248547-251887
MLGAENQVEPVIIPFEPARPVPRAEGAPDGAQRVWRHVAPTVWNLHSGWGGSHESPSKGSGPARPGRSSSPPADSRPPEQGGWGSSQASAGKGSWSGHPSSPPERRSGWGSSAQDSASKGSWHGRSSSPPADSRTQGQSGGWGNAWSQAEAGKGTWQGRSTSPPADSAQREKHSDWGSTQASGSKISWSSCSSGSWGNQGKSVVECMLEIENPPHLGHFNYDPNQCVRIDITGLPGYLSERKGPEYFSAQRDKVANLFSPFFQNILGLNLMERSGGTIAHVVLPREHTSAFEEFVAMKFPELRVRISKNLPQKHPRGGRR